MALPEGEFLAYAAGFFDADGTVGVYRYTNKSTRAGYEFRLQTKIAQKLWLEAFLEWRGRWGGYLGSQKGSQGGNYWRWQLYANDAAQFLEDVLPWLRNKHDQAELAIRFQSRKKSCGRALSRAESEWQQAVSDAIKELKHTDKSTPPKLKSKVDQLEEQVAELGTQLQFWVNSQQRGCSL